ncbi:hypothetical protein J2X11_000793 [Aeromicrobium panaciterrae]|uniref:Uncharacterized protein n=1 Tax=Aeromicrobium panaciterrae TaxID=363861 RepID=A0ABU1ULC3_9ACTN|nr:hypothetical protein [Aeromicrobium panaciterrae]MDR7085954.1 hypothetical protein [Aeromicrobium panaciterrae]
MNRTIRNLVIAVPLATVGFTMVGATAATAGPNGPVIIIQPNGGDPEPPKPKPQDKAPVPQPKGPQDKAPVPQPKGPQDKAPAPQPQAPQAPDTDTAEKKEAKVVAVDSAKGSPDSIDRSEDLFAGEAFETELVADDTDNGGLDITWLLVGGGIVTASGIAFAASKRANA